MKEISIKYKIVGRAVDSTTASKGGAMPVDLSAYLPKAVWEKVFKLVTDEAGNEHLFANLPFASKYGITMFADDGSLNLPNIYDGLPIDWNTIYWEDVKDADGNVTGRVLKAAGGGGEGGTVNGITLEQLETYLGVNKYATQPWVEGKGYLSAITSKLVTDALGFTPYDSASFTKDDIKSTLGISDWALDENKPSYTTKEITEEDNLYFTNQRAVDALADTLKNYVTIDGEQPINGLKNFTNGLQIDGLGITKSQDDVIYLDANLVVRGGITMYGTNSVDVPTIMDALLYDDSTLGVNSEGKLYVKVGTGGGVADSVRWENVIGRPTLLSSFTDDVVSGKYLPLRGGTLEGNLIFKSNKGGINSYIRDSVFPAHIYRLVWDVKGEVYDHYYNPDFKSSTYTSANLRVKANDGFATLRFSGDGSFTWNGNKVWHEGNHGSGSGLDADMLDGKQPNELNVASAAKLNDNSSFTAWGQTFFTNGKPKDVDGVLTLTGGSSAFDKTAISFNRQSSGEGARIGIDSSGGLGLYSIHHIYLRPHVSLGESSQNGVVISKDYITYNGKYMYHEGNFNPSKYLRIDGSSEMTGRLQTSLNNGLYYKENGLVAWLDNTNAWTGVTGFATVAIGSVGLPTTIRSNGDTLYHYNSGLGFRYKIWDAYNSNNYDNPWKASSINIGTDRKIIGTDSAVDDIWIKCGDTYMLNCHEDEMCVRRGSTATEVTLGSNAYPWKSLYAHWINSSNAGGYRGYLFLNASTELHLRYNDTESKSLVLNSESFKPTRVAADNVKLGNADSRWNGIYLGAKTNSAVNTHGVIFCDTSANGKAMIGCNSAGGVGLYGCENVYIRPNCKSVSGAVESSGIGLTISGEGLLCSGGITMYSDQRKKTILNHVELSLKQIADAPLIEHYYNSDAMRTTHVGSIAQYWASMNDWFCKLDGEGYYTMEIQNAALASAISIARELQRYESKTDKKIRLLKKRIGELEEEIEKLKTA